MSCMLTKATKLNYAPVFNVEYSNLLDYIYTVFQKKTGTPSSY